MKEITGGLIYFALVFAVAFVLGTIRVMVVAPATGPLVAVLIETPIILIIAWFICRGAIAYAKVPAETGSRITMGVVAFAALMVVEYLLSYALTGASLSAYVGQLVTFVGLVGLFGQLLFAVIPLLQLRTES
jgi:hypothetical protein